VPGPNHPLFTLYLAAALVTLVCQAVAYPRVRRADAHHLCPIHRGFQQQQMLYPASWQIGGALISTLLWPIAIFPILAVGRMRGLPLLPWWMPCRACTRT
jgi:hypothetical protein